MKEITRKQKVYIDQKTGRHLSGAEIIEIRKRENAMAQVKENIGKLDNVEFVDKFRDIEMGVRIKRTVNGALRLDIENAKIHKDGDQFTERQMLDIEKVIQVINGILYKHSVATKDAMGPIFDMAPQLKDALSGSAPDLPTISDEDLEEVA